MGSCLISIVHVLSSQLGASLLLTSRHKTAQNTNYSIVFFPVNSALGSVFYDDKLSLMPLENNAQQLKL